MNDNALISVVSMDDDAVVVAVVVVLWKVLSLVLQLVPSVEEPVSRDVIDNHDDHDTAS